MPQYYDPDCLEAFLLASTLPMIIQLSGKSTHFGSEMLVYSKNNLSANLKVF